MNKKSLDDMIANPKNLERILDNLKDGIIAHDLDRRIFYYNRGAEKITGYKRSEILGKDCHIAHGGPICGKRCSFCDNKPVINDSIEYSINIVTKNGELRRIKVCATMMKDENHKNFGVLASFRDVTDIIDLKRKVGELAGFSNIIGKDSKMLDVFQQITDVAVYDFPVHIYGETGTGKELVANAIHNASTRSGASFVPINCGALPEGLIESELFGHVKGAFSGAIRNKKGRFELADKGTVFLDEVAELSKPMQVKILRFLQEGTFEKVGGEKTVSVDVRIISATNKNLKKEIRKNKFREDLYYRLNVIPINIPPIRERKNDIPLLIEHFILSAKNNRTDVLPKFSDEAMSMMMSYKWPGNVRELQNAVLFSIVKCHKKFISPQDLPMEVNACINPSPRRGPSRKLDVSSVREALTKTGANKAKAARILGVGRATLYRFLGENPAEFQDD
ncbi:sigma 54-interacting transcriptional regulator [Desulfobacterales bacterium HSG16]|nr:sigma 54-interacting transcriptional regulator [Desulfobacterales bacterium HSG16]